MKSPEALSEVVRARGGKVTPQRERIFRYLAEHGDHPTAEAVYAAVVVDMPTISLRTVYQTLNDLVALRELSQLDVGGAGALRHHGRDPPPPRVQQLWPRHRRAG